MREEMNANDETQNFPPLPVLTGERAISSAGAEALRVFGSRFSLIAALILTVFLPYDILEKILSLTFFTEQERGGFLAIVMTVGLYSLFSPLFCGAFITVLAAERDGHYISYNEALANGFRFWGRLFVAKMVTETLVTVLLCCLIVPGALLLTRLAFAEFCIVCENRDVRAAFRRSAFLTAGRRWSLFGWYSLGMGIFILLVLVSIFVERSTGVSGAIKAIQDVAVTLIGHFLSAFVGVVWFLLYSQATRDEKLLISRPLL